MTNQITDTKLLENQILGNQIAGTLMIKPLILCMRVSKWVYLGFPKVPLVKIQL